MNQEMSPIDWAKRPILEKYADFSGRAPRAEFWWYTLALMIVFVIVAIIEGILGIHRMIAGMYGPISALLLLATLIPSLAVGVRRLHDTNRTGWWLLLPLIPDVLMIVMALTTAGAVAAGGGMGAAMGGLAITGLLGLITFVGAVVVFIFDVLPGTNGPNRFGPDPYGSDVGEVFA
jgi:uncharacterized membrane protein YhaH (DUF805 family)